MLGELGADANAQLEDGWTPLHIAAYYGRHEAASVLVHELGADTGMKTIHGRTPSTIVPDCHRPSFVGIL